VGLIGVLWVVLWAPNFSRGGIGPAVDTTQVEGIGSGVASSSTAAPAPLPPAIIAPDAARTLLATLPIKGRAPETGYGRTIQFGQAWIDTDHNGCDTRNDILARDLTAITRSGACKVLSGVLADPYTGERIDFVRGNTTSAKVQIDHVVALLDAWETGAQQLSATQRVAFANDPRNLLAVGGEINQAKGSGDAATWLPPNKAFRCAYVSRQIVVKAAYGLWVTQAEHDAMTRVLAACSR
jgi:hypothetical protein